jgi:hypothetical protein
MPSSSVLSHVALVRTDVSEELCASIIMVTRTSELETALAVTTNRRTLRRIPFTIERTNEQLVLVEFRTERTNAVESL